MWWFYFCSHAFAMFAHKNFYGCAGYVDDPLPNIVYIALWWCLLALYGSTMSILWLSLCIPLALCGVFRTIVSFCLVYRLPYIKNKDLKNNSWLVWGHNVCMGMKNWSKLEIWRDKILIHTLELELWHFKDFPYSCTCTFVQESCAFPPMHA